MTSENQPVTLDLLSTGSGGRIVAVRGTGAIRRRLLDLGLIRGAELQVVRVAPLGDPIEIAVRGSLVSLRRSEAAAIGIVEPAS